MALKEMPKVGDVLIAKKERGGIMEGSIIEGNEYVVQSIDQDGEAVIIGDDGTRWYIGGYEFKWFTLKESEAHPVEASPSVIELLSNLALRLTKVDDDRPTQSDTVDNVNSPQHYRHGRFETIELIEDITKKYDDGFVAYCVGNAVKYVDRAPFKHGSPSEDLRKAAWYLTRAAEHTDATTPPSA